MINLKILIGALILLLGCTQSNNQIVGGSADTGNAFVVGTVLNKNGETVNNAIVALVPSTYNPILDSAYIELQRDTTGIDGIYSFKFDSTKEFNVEIIKKDNNTSRLVPLEISKISDTLYVNDTLKEPGTIEIQYNVTLDTLNTFTFIQGSTYYVDFKSASNTVDGNMSVTLNNVPSEVWLDVYLLEEDTIMIINENLWVNSQDTSHIWYDGKKSN